MLYGHVAYDLKDGGHSEKDWAARAVLTKSSDDESLQLGFYQIYLVCIAAAIVCHRSINTYKDTASPSASK